jgi:hypothetical protein
MTSTDVGTRAWIAEEHMDPNQDFRIIGLGSSTNVMVAFQHDQIQVATLSITHI